MPSANLPPFSRLYRGIALKEGDHCRWCGAFSGKKLKPRWRARDSYLECPVCDRPDPNSTVPAFQPEPLASGQ